MKLMVFLGGCYSKLLIFLLQTKRMKEKKKIKAKTKINATRFLSYFT